MDIFIGVIIGLLVLMFLVTAHEFGHFLMARRNGVRVLEFGICFPPRAVAWAKDPKTKKWKRIPKEDWKKPQDGLIFSLNWLPIGGFCQMDGESATDSRKGTFGAANFAAKTKILFGGVAANWIIAFIILTILAWTGMPEFLENQYTVVSDTRTNAVPVQVGSVAEGSPAATAGMVAGDYIVAVDGEELWSASKITEYNSGHAGEEVTYTIERTQPAECAEASCPEETKQIDLIAQLNPADSEYLLGVTMSTTQSLSYSTWSAPIVGAGLTLQITGETFKGIGMLLWNLFSGLFSQLSLNADTRESGQAAISEVGDSVSGPVGIIGSLFPAFASSGATNLAFLAAIISISLACMNVLPIPALDGGRWLLIAIFKLLKKPLKKETEEKIVSRAFAVLLVLIFVVTVLDITKLGR